jgi:hypothetical protein
MTDAKLITEKGKPLLQTLLMFLLELIQEKVQFLNLMRTLRFSSTLLIMVLQDSLLCQLEDISMLIS